MAKSESKAYNPAAVAERVWKFWEAGNFFRAEPDARPRDKRFSICIPPPNVTGALHLGHALNNTLQDILVRQKRMAGFNTLWVVGTDHAGIATQATVEKTIRKDEGKSRHDLGREKLVERIWEWKEKYGSRIVEQLKLMGCSCDYSRERFTLDEGCAKAVRETFFKLFRDGLIFRGKRLVNWDTQLQTAVADDEVYHEAVKGHFYHFKYPLVAASDGTLVRESLLAPTAGGIPSHVHIATTRPETMLADTAVAVHPDPAGEMDKREKELRAKLAEASAKERPDIEKSLADLAERRTTHLPTLIQLRDLAKGGAKLMLPLMNREIPLICDDWADPTLGTGCVKITPAHDANDHEVFKRHPEIGIINVMTPDGRVTDEGGIYKGLKFEEARKKVVADLEALGLVEKIEDREIELAHSDRSKTPIEPFYSDQWFVKMGDPEGTSEGAAPSQNSPVSTRGGDVSSQTRGDSRQSTEGSPQNSNLTGQTEAGLRQHAHFSSQKVSDSSQNHAVSARRSTAPSSSGPATGPGRAENAAGRIGLAQMAMDAICHDDSHYDAPASRKDCAKVHIFPRRYSKTYLDWLGEKRDWCISRQLWWGHRIPVWERRLPKGQSSRHAPSASLKELSVDWFMPDFDQAEIRGNVVNDFTIANAPTFRYICLRSEPTDQDKQILNEHGYVEEDDVLDTWFSSALWPHSTLGWTGDQATPGEWTSILHDSAGANPEDVDAQGKPSPALAATIERYRSYFQHLEVATEIAIRPAADVVQSWVVLTPKSARAIAAIKVLNDSYNMEGDNYIDDALSRHGFSEFATDDAFKNSIEELARIQEAPFEPGNRLLDYFYPTSVLSTAREIITLWVARMVLTGLYNIGDIPFHDVVIHPVIQDGQGRKMSKTLGNGVDPVDIIDKYGADALRFTLAELATETQDIRMPVKKEKLADGREINVSEKFEKGRNFCNKIWQASTGFVLANLGEFAPKPLTLDTLRLEDRWILSRLTACITEMNRALAAYHFSEATQAAYRFFWDEYCAWYIEMSKSRLVAAPRGDDMPTNVRGHGTQTQEDGDVCRQVLVFVLDQALRLLHPITPFVTEAVWAELNAACPKRGLKTLFDGEPALIAAAWPTADASLMDAEVDRRMALIQSIVGDVREIRTTINGYRSKGGQPAVKTLPSATVLVDSARRDFLQSYPAMICSLGGCDAIEVRADQSKPDKALGRVRGLAPVFAPVTGLVDLMEVQKDIEKQLADLRAALTRAEAQLSNEGFVSKADPAMVEQARARVATIREQIAALEDQLSGLA